MWKRLTTSTEEMDKYQLLDKRGQGSYAVVWKARNRNNELVAIKQVEIHNAIHFTGLVWFLLQTVFVVLAFWLFGFLAFWLCEFFFIFRVAFDKKCLYALHILFVVLISLTSFGKPLLIGMKSRRLLKWRSLVSYYSFHCAKLDFAPQKFVWRDILSLGDSARLNMILPYRTATCLERCPRDSQEYRSFKRSYPRTWRGESLLRQLIAFPQRFMRIKSTFFYV